MVAAVAVLEPEVAENSADAPIFACITPPGSQPTHFRIASFFLNWIMNVVGLSRQINGLIESLDVGPMVLMAWIVLFYLVLGLFMESISITVMTLPIIAPVVFAAGFDPIWFGVVFVILLECGMITPPVGMNLFVVQGLRRGGTVTDVAIGASPFVVVMLGLIALMIVFPQLALFLPSLG